MIVENFDSTFYSVLLFDSWCSAHCFLPILSKRIKPDIQKHTWSINLPFLLIDPPGFFQQNKGTEPESQKINFCIGNNMHFTAPV